MDSDEPADGIRHADVKEATEATPGALLPSEVRTEDTEEDMHIDAFAAAVGMQRKPPCFVDLSNKDVNCMNNECFRLAALACFLLEAFDQTCKREEDRFCFTAWVICCLWAMVGRAVNKPNNSKNRGDQSPNCGL